MAIAPLFQEQLQLAKQEGRQEGIEQGIQQGVQLGQRLILENLLRQRFGELTPEIVSLVSPVTAMSVTEFTSLLLEISMLRVDEIGQQQTLRLLAEKINKIPPNEEN